MKKLRSKGLKFGGEVWFLSVNRVKKIALFMVTFTAFVILATSFGKNFLVQTYLNSDILSLSTELNATKQKFEKLQEQYQLVAEKYLEKQKIKRIISSINPSLDDEHTDMWVRSLTKNARLIESHLNKYSDVKLDLEQSKYALGTGISLLIAIAALESDFVVDARSRKGAYGPMQINKITAKHIGLDNRKNPEANMDGGAMYFASLLEKYEDHTDQIELALASYNAGKTRVSQDWVPQWGYDWLDIHQGLVEDGRRFKETRNYVTSIIALSQMFVSGDWNQHDKYFWSNYKFYARKFDLAEFYAASIYPE